MKDEGLKVKLLELLIDQLSGHPMSLDPKEEPAPEGMDVAALIKEEPKDGEEMESKPDFGAESEEPSEEPCAECGKSPCEC
jgi:hypothetical protein